MPRISQNTSLKYRPESLASNIYAIPLLCCPYMDFTFCTTTVQSDRESSITQTYDVREVYKFEEQHS